MATSTQNLPLGGGHTAGIFSDTTGDGPEIGDLVVIVDKAKNLPNRKTMGKQDPYCAARLGKEAKKTTTDKRGGQTPKWDQELRFTVHDGADYYQLKVSVFNDDKKTDLIGETWVNLESVVIPGGGQNDLWHSLNYKGKYAGEIRIEITYYDTRPKDEAVLEKRREAARQTPVGGPRESLGGPRQLKQMKRRPLPGEPNSTNISPYSTPLEHPAGHELHGARSRQETPTRGFKEPRALPSPYYQAGTHTPPQQPIGYSQPDFPDVDQYPHVPTYDSPSEEPFDSPYEMGHQHHQQPQFIHEPPSDFPDGPPPPPPAHNSRHASPGLPVLPSSTHTHAPPHLVHSHSAPSDMALSYTENYDQPSRWQNQYHQQQFQEDEPSYSGNFHHPPPRNDYSRQSTESDAPLPLAPHSRRLSRGLPPSAEEESTMYDHEYDAPHRDYQLGQDDRFQNERQPMRHSLQGPASGVPTSLVAGYNPMTPTRDLQQPTPMTSLPSAPRLPPAHSPYAQQHGGSSPTRPSPLHDGPRAHQSSNPIVDPRTVTPDARRPVRKSVSPQPNRRADGERRLSGVPFSPDSFDALNPNAGSSPASRTEYDTPEMAREAARISARGDPSAPIISSDGRVIDPSDHLPSDTWAPEPDRKVSTKASSPFDNRTRHSPAGAQPMPPAARRGLRDSGPRPLSTPTPIYAHSADPQTPSSGRNRLQKRPKGQGSSPVASPVSPLGYSYMDENSRSMPQSPSDYPLRERHNYGQAQAQYSSHPPRNSPAGPPPVPAKIPMDGYDKLSEELKRIDIGSGRRRIRY